MRKPIPKSVRKQVYAKYNGHCAYCDNGRFDKGWNACLDMILENGLSDCVD